MILLIVDININTMKMYNDVFKSLNSGAELLTEHNIIRGYRIVKVNGNSVSIDGQSFNWDVFFEVNHPVILK